MAKADELMIRYERGEPAPSTVLLQEPTETPAAAPMTSPLMNQNLMQVCQRVCSGSAPPVLSHHTVDNAFLPLSPQIARVSAMIRPQKLTKSIPFRQPPKASSKYPPSPLDYTEKITDPDIEMTEDKTPEIIMISPEATPPSTEDEDESGASKYSYQHDQIQFTLKRKNKKKNKYQKLVQVVQKDEDVKGVELVTLAGEIGAPGPSSKKMFGFKLKKPRAVTYAHHLDNILDKMLQSNARDLVEIPLALRYPLNQGPFMLQQSSLALGSAFFPVHSGVVEMCVNNMTASLDCNMSHQEMADIEQAVLFCGEALKLVTVCRQIIKSKKKKNKIPESKIDTVCDKMLADAQHGLDTAYIHVIVRRRREILDDPYTVEDRIYRMTQGVSNKPVLFE